MADLEQCLSWLDQGFKVTFEAWDLDQYLYYENGKIFLTETKYRARYFEPVEFLNYGACWKLVNPKDDPKFDNKTYEQQMFELGQKVMESMKFPRNR